MKKQHKRTYRRKVISSSSLQAWVYLLELECGHAQQLKTYTLRIPKTVTCVTCARDSLQLLKEN